MRLTKIATALLAGSLLSGCASTIETQSSAAPGRAQAAQRPNILIVLMDDMGYSDIGAYGSEIRTPNIDRLAAQGLSYSQFYVYPRCSPTRAALLTGRYPHEVGLSFLTTPPGSKPPPGPFQGYLDPAAPTLAGILKDAGYGTYASGKWHLGEAPEHWPRRYGFDRYFGLISGASSYYELLETEVGERTMALDDKEWVPPATGFFMTDAITDRAVEFLREHERQDPDRPFFLYLAYTAPHWPLHARESDIRSYEGVYDQGWNSIRDQRDANLKRRGLIQAGSPIADAPPTASDWASYPKKAEWIRKMQTHAAMMTHADRGIGVVLDELRRSSDYDNTVVVFLTDNGASSEDIDQRPANDRSRRIGERGSYVSLGPDGAFVANTPLRDFKGTTFEGSVRSPLVISWPRGLPGASRGAMRTEVAGVLDLVPTLARLGGVPEATTALLAGRDLARSWTGHGQAVPSPFYWEHLGWRGVREGRWKAVKDPRETGWRLFEIEKDPAEKNDLARQYSKQTQQMAQQWQNWADKTGVKEIDQRQLLRIFFPRLDPAAQQ